MYSSAVAGFPADGNRVRKDSKKLLLADRKMWVSYLCWMEALLGKSCSTLQWTWFHTSLSYPVLQKPHQKNNFTTLEDHCADMSPIDCTNSNHPSQKRQVSIEIRASSRVSLLLSICFVRHAAHVSRQTPALIRMQGIMALFLILLLISQMTPSKAHDLSVPFK